MEYTTVVGVTAERPLGEQYAAMLMACCVGEAERDAGGHALVVVNDISPMVRCVACAVHAVCAVHVVLHAVNCGGCGSARQACGWGWLVQRGSVPPGTVATGCVSSSNLTSTAFNLLPLQVRMWEEITVALAGLGPVALEVVQDPDAQASALGWGRV